jgi:MtN3 and saliva related transmembrane protein
MDGIQLLGFTAALATTIANFPQTYRIIKTKSTKDISVGTYILLTLGCGMWLIYAILKNDIPLLIANAISTTICTIILILKTLSHKQLIKLSEKIEE